jgi:hypothetical protein
LYLPPDEPTSTAIVVRRRENIADGFYWVCEEVDPEEWSFRFPGQPVPDPVTIYHERVCVYRGNITHNLGKMAAAADIYMCLWRPEEIDIDTAGQLIEPLQKALDDMRATPEKFEKHNSPNGWGMYPHFVSFVAKYLAACREFSTARIRVCR